MKQFASDVGMRPIVMDYHVHDKSVAAISHVPHLLSTALVHVVSDNDDEESICSYLPQVAFVTCQELQLLLLKCGNRYV